MLPVKEDIIKDILIKNCKVIVHMRQEIDYKRFGLILGAGVITELGFPNWKDLLIKIATDPNVNGKEIINFNIKNKTNNASLSQLLFYKFKENEEKQKPKDIDELAFNKFENEIKAKWLTIIHDQLYNTVPKSIEDLKCKDKYLQNFIDIIKKSNVTINYNFDDTIERLIRDSLSEPEKNKKRGYRSTWSANMKLYPESCTIYHPNGFLPQNITDSPSPDIVFLEDSFADQLIDSIYGSYSFLVNHLAQNTCLLLGLSLEDQTLRHLLRQNAKRYPGQYHYYISFVNSKKEMDADYQNSVKISNFEVYNLITLFFTSEEIAALGILLSKNNEDFKELVNNYHREKIYNIYRYFITGCVSVGKTTMVNEFKSLCTIDEWFEPLPRGMEKDPSLASEEELKEIDKWVATQVFLKNKKLIDFNSGILIIDRCPLDAFAFTPKDKWKEKAKLLNTELTGNPCNQNPLVSGQIILLQGDPEIMAARALVKFRQTSAEKLREQQDMLKLVYLNREQGVTVIDTREKSIWQITKELSKLIYLNEYAPAPMQDWLQKIENGEIIAK